MIKDRYKTPLLFLFFLFIFLSQFTTRTPDYEARGVDFQVLIRVGFIFLLSFLILPSYKGFISGLKDKTEFVFFLLLTSFIVITIFSPNFYSFYALLTLFITAFIVRFYISNYGLRTILLCFTYTSLVVFVLSLFFYFFIPDIGRYSYWQWGEFITSPRMQGIVGHPNTLAILAGTNLLVLFHLNRTIKLSRFIYFIMILTTILVLFLTNSKTNIIATVFCLLVFFFFRSKYHAVILVSFILVFSFAVLLYFFSPSIYIDFLKSVSRTGDINEILTFTGRSSIWLFILDVIYQKPIFGWGYATGGDILVKNSEGVGFTVAQTHNLYLQIILSGGIVSFAIFVFVIKNIIKATYNKEKFILMQLMLYILFVGLSESIIFNTISNLAFIIFCIAIYGASSRIKT